MAHAAVVQSEGRGLRIEADLIKQAFSTSSSVQQTMLRCTQKLFAQISETAVSNRHLSIEQQLSPERLKLSEKDYQMT